MYATSKVFASYLIHFPDDGKHIHNRICFTTLSCFSGFRIKQ